MEAPLVRAVALSQPLGSIYPLISPSGRPGVCVCVLVTQSCPTLCKPMD